MARATDMDTTAGTTNAGLPSTSKELVKVAVLGAGNFGTAMAQIAARSGHTVSLYSRDRAQVDAINTTHRNPRYFSDFILPESISATDRHDMTSSLSPSS